MKKKEKKLYLQRKKRYLKKIIGTSERPRLSVFRSHRNISAQIINDEKKETIVSSSTLTKEIKTKINSGATKEAAFIVGEILGVKAKEKNITKIVFDRGKKPYHGRIAEVARGARTQGLSF